MARLIRELQAVSGSDSTCASIAPGPEADAQEFTCPNSWTVTITKRDAWFLE